MRSDAHAQNDGTGTVKSILPFKIGFAARVTAFKNFTATVSTGGASE
jgi:hypothetical protein